MKLKPGIIWPTIIVGALTLHVVASLVFVFVATSDPSYAVEEDYYQKALEWDSKRTQDATNSQLGWRIELTAMPPAALGNEAVLEALFFDSDNSPLEGASISVEAFHNARAHNILHAQFEARGGGLYQTALPMKHNGRWELRVTATRGEDRFTFRTTQHLFVEGTW